MQKIRKFSGLMAVTALLAGLLWGPQILAQTETTSPASTTDGVPTFPPAQPPPDIPPPIPPKKRNTEEEAPVVSIRTEENRTIEEYRRGGRIYMVKVTPLEGLAYYYMDMDGDGELELQPSDEPMNPVVPHMWKIKEW